MRADLASEGLELRTHWDTLAWLRAHGFPINPFAERLEPFREDPRLMLLIDQPWTLNPPSIETVGSIAGLALLSTALAYILYFRILATAGATNLSLVTFLIPVSAILLGVLVLGGTLLTRHVLGMALIGVGLAAVDGRLWGAFRRRFASK